MTSMFPFLAARLHHVPRRTVVAVCSALVPPAVPHALVARCGDFRRPYSASVATRSSKVTAAYLQAERELSELSLAARTAIRSGDYSAGKDAARQFYTAAAEHYGEKHPVAASALNNLAVAHKHLGELSEASALYEQAIGVYEAVFGEEHPSLAMALANAGLLYKAMAEQATGLDEMALVDTAAGHLERALHVRRRVVSGDDPVLPLSMAQLATVLRMQQRFAEAEDLLMEAAELLKERPEHPYRATVLNNLGYLLKEQGKELDRAERCYKEAVAVREEVLGTDHVDTIAALHNLAELYLVQGQEERATALQVDILRRLGATPVASEQPPPTATSS